MKPVNVQRYFRNPQNIGLPPLGQIDLRFDPVSGAFIQVNPDGSTSPVDRTLTQAMVEAAITDEEDFREVLEVVPRRHYLSGPGVPFQIMRARLDRGEDAAAGFIGDSVYSDSVAVPYRFAVALAARYPNHRVELRRAADNMQSITTTVLQEGPLGPRYRGFDASSSSGAFLPGSAARASINGAAALRIEFAFSHAAGSINGSGFPIASGSFAFYVGNGSGGNRTRVAINSSTGFIYLTVQGVGAGSADINSGAAITALTADTIRYIRIDFTANDGSNSRATFYQSTDGVNYTGVGSANIAGTAITTTIADTNSYWLASASGAPVVTSTKIYRAQFYAGSPLNPVLPERMDAWTAVTGSSSQTSLLGGSPTIFIDQAAQPGATLRPDPAQDFFTGSGAGDFPVEAYRCWVDHLPDFVSMESSINDTGMSQAEWDSQMDAAVTAVRARYARDPVIIHTTVSPYPGFGANDELANQHRRRQADIMLYAARNGRTCTDIYQAFVDANNSAYYVGSPNVHPSSAGYAFWGTIFWDCFLDGTNEPPVVAA